MLSIILNWIYMGIIVYFLGNSYMHFFDIVVERVSSYKEHVAKQKVEYKNLGHVLLAGIMMATLYAQTFSVFYKVSLVANILLVILVIVYISLDKKYLLGRWRWMIEGCPENQLLRVGVPMVIVLTILAFAASSAGPAKLIDTDWYHAQTIRWIEEYGCVKGIANLFYALGFNNAQHYFDALFSMKPYLGQSLRGTGGFFGLVIFIHGLSRVIQWKKHRFHIADAIAVWEIAYSIIVTAFFADPYVDTLPNILVLFIMTEWFALLEASEVSNHIEETKIKWLAFYCILGVFATVCKTSVAMVVLLVVYPCSLLVKGKKWKEIFLYLGIGFVVAIPFLVTNVITTGYPIYLLSALDFFDVPWKIDPAILKYSVDNMVAFARMPSVSMEEALNMGMRWIPDWFMRESISHKLLYIGIIIVVIYDLTQIVWGCIKSKKLAVWYVWPRICVYAGLVYWFVTIPQVKYCWSFLILPLAIVPVYYYERRKQGYNIIVKLVCLMCVGLLLMYTGFYSLRTLGYMKDGVLKNFVMQQDYENHVFDTVEKNGHTFYTRIENGDIVCGYYIFPYLDNKSDLHRLVVGESLGEGFYIEE